MDCITFEDFETIYTQDADVDLILKLAGRGYRFKIEDGNITRIIQPEGILNHVRR